MAEAFEEADLRAGFAAGGRLVGAFIVHRGDKNSVVYLRPDWVPGRGYRLIQTYRGKSGARSFRRLHSAWEFIRQAGWSGSVTIYPAGDERLKRFAGVAARDFVAPSTAPGEERVAPCM